LEDVMDGLEPDRRARIGARAEEIDQKYLTLKKLRSHMELTQAALARKMGVAQPTIAQLEQRNDIHVSTLRKYVEALGGTLSIIADMPGKGPVPLT
ncbi:MAG: helix-turn-helix domain-containing protein, partial [SAR116 cluster bacterium]|nr:helix-turn-helix domain-containing protein [SAR116 cluster bacterium]